VLDDPNFLGRWPWLKDLMSPPDTVTENDGIQFKENPMDNNMKNNPIVYTSREKMFDTIEEHSPEPLPIAVAHTRNLVKERDEKRNNNNYCKYLFFCFV
jgi:hypothetical protein